MYILFFSIGFILGVAIRVPILYQLVKIIAKQAIFNKELMIENGFYKKKAGYGINEKTPEELIEIINDNK